jgi:hypothetical protein
MSMTQKLTAKIQSQTPINFVEYLRKIRDPTVVEVGRLHKLRLLLRNETVAWTDTFVSLGGMEEIVSLLHRIMEIEWREEHEDTLLHETLLCLKALCTTALAMQHLTSIQSTLFPALLHMIFDEERKGPSEFATRNIITSVLFMYLEAAPAAERPQRAEILLSYLKDPEPKDDEKPLPFVMEMQRQRPYRVWSKEISNVTKEVFWIFLHRYNVVPLEDKEKAPSNDRYVYQSAHFPQPLAPLPTAPYVGGVEWEATNYLTSHMFLLNGILACLPTATARNKVRAEMEISGWERCMGASTSCMRMCKATLYPGLHTSLATWVAAAAGDGWDVSPVRFGPKEENTTGSYKPRSASPNKKKDAPPKLEMPKLDVGTPKLEGGVDVRGRAKLFEDGWI